MFIYKITNKVNNKIYIGQTKVSLQARFNGHKSDAKNKSKSMILHRAIRKYGIDNFIIEEIAGANSEAELNYLEWFLIIKLNSMYPIGYNSVPGGNVKGMPQCIKDKIGKKTKERMTPSMKKRLSDSLTGVKFNEDRLKNHKHSMVITRGKSIILEKVSNGEIIELPSISSIVVFGGNVKNITSILNGRDHYKPYIGYWVYYKGESRRQETKPDKLRNYYLFNKNTLQNKIIKGFSNVKLFLNVKHSFLYKRLNTENHIDGWIIASSPQQTFANNAGGR